MFWIILSAILAAMVLYTAAVFWYMRKILKKPLVLPVSGENPVDIRKDQKYGAADGRDLFCDLYIPARRTQGETSPAVVLVHGDGPDFLIRNAKEWRIFQDYGRLLAAEGFVGITFTHRGTQGGKRPASAEDDARDLVQFIRSHARDFGIDPDRIFLWAFSAGAAGGISWILRDGPEYIRGLVSYYGLLKSDDARYSPVDILKEKRKRVPPLFIVKAERDRSRAVLSSNDEMYFLGQAEPIQVEFLSHPGGRHAFDVLDDNEESRNIIRRTIEFLKENS